MSPFVCLIVSIGYLIINVFSWGDNVILGPNSPNDWHSWLNKITTQKEKDLQSISYNASIYNDTGIYWTQSSFIQPQMHGYDQYFYNITQHSYTFDKWLNDLNNRYGGIDSMLFWVTYTNIGADDRNQFDLNLAIPGSIKSLQSMTKYFHSKNIRVLFPYNPWDTGTRYSGNPDYITMAQFLNQTGGDGFNGDTMDNIPQNFYLYSRNTFNHSIAMQPEGGGNLESMNWDNMGWGENWNPYPYKPLVAKWKFYDGRFMTDIVDRWMHNRTNDLQNTFFNGIGYVSWENVWGSWNGIVPRDAAVIQRIATILRYFGNKDNNPNQMSFTQSTNWIPYIPIIADTKHWNNLFASAFILNANTNKQQILFLIVNRNNIDIYLANITFDNTFIINYNDINIYDCYYGKLLNSTNNVKDNTINIKIDIEALGYSAILVTFDNRKNNKYLNIFLNTMSNMTNNKSLNSYSTKWNYLQQEMVTIKSTKQYNDTPNNMISIPFGIHFYNNNGVEIEGTDNDGVDVEYFWEMYPKREHSQYMTLPKFYIDKYPVTCSDYKKYLLSSKYEPNDKYNYLKNWIYNKTRNEYNYPNGYDNKPVTYLGLNEARLYCSYFGKRLPHSYEWHYAAQGNTSYLYPWGNTMKMGTNFPMQQNGRNIPGPSDVDAFEPNGNSMFGVTDLIGNVWQYTDEFKDIHTRSVIVMGSSNYRPQGSQWYFPTAYQLNQHNKYFLMDNSYERCGTIGFRCAADAVQPININPMFWNGHGIYCPIDNIYSSLSSSVLLCGSINPQMGYNNLSNTGSIDWVQFGSNLNDSSQFKMIRKKRNDGIEYISDINTLSKVSLYSGNPNGYYWNDGRDDIPVILKNDATTNGIYIYESNINFNINNLNGGNIYKLKIYVGVYKNRGLLNVECNNDNNNDIFNDNTIYNKDGTTTIVYDLIINLKSFANNDNVQCSVKWIYDNGEGNITLQAIALALLQ